VLTIAFVQAGVDFAYHRNYNALLEVEWEGGDSDMMEEEYADGRYRRDQLHPEMGGRCFWAQLEGAGYHCSEMRLM
jgi:hypothetical protein